MRRVALFFLVLLTLPLLALVPRPAVSQEGYQARSVALFKEALKVFRHPRCMNCHPAGDQPTQGIEMHAHIMNVLRGDDNHGFTTLRSNSCHGVKNFDLDARHGVPGNPRWALAPREQGWQGLSDRELCNLFKDPKRTHKTMDEFVEHNAHDELVAWGWNPGAGRAPVPGTQAEFGKLVAEWVATGAACP